MVKNNIEVDVKQEIKCTETERLRRKLLRIFIPQNHM